MQEIQDYKNNIGQAAESIIANGLGLQSKGTKYHCPNIYAHKNGDKNPSMSWDSNALQFHCFTCGQNIDIYAYYKDHLNYSHRDIVGESISKDSNKPTMQQRRDIFKEQLDMCKPLTKECIGYIKKRGLAVETMNKFGLKSHKNKIAFPYYKYSTIVGVKTRKAGKHNKETDGEKMLSLKGSKPYLFNSQNVTLEGEIIVCEGEFDCMVISQCGFENVISVGAGANSMNSLFEQAEDFFKAFDTIIIVSDNDDSGDNMDLAFMEKFGEKVKLIDKRIYDKNDVNEEYVINGQEKIKALIHSARLKVEGIRDLEEQPYEGLRDIERIFIPTGIETIDHALNDLGSGMLTLITGRSNGGKTTFCNQIKVNAIDKGFKVFEVSGEGLQDELLNNFYTSIIGREEKLYTVKKMNKRYRKEPTKEALEGLKKWHYKKYKLFTKGDSKLKSTKQLFEMFTAEVKTNKHDLIIIDNLMSILSVSQSSEKLEAQADFVQRCCDFAKAYNVHIILVLHPNKSYQKGTNMDFEQISGTSDIANKSDNIITVIREYEDEEIENGVNGRIQISKNRYYPDLPVVKTYFEKETGLLLELDEEKGERKKYELDWRKFIPKKVKYYNGEEQEFEDGEMGCPF